MPPNVGEERKALWEENPAARKRLVPATNTASTRGQKAEP
jgi:hypothetical protein